MSEWAHILKGDWIDDGSDRSRFRDAATKQVADLMSMPPGARLLLVEPDPLLFAAGVAAAFACDRRVRLFLGSPQWGAAERQAVAHMVMPERVWGSFDRVGDGAASDVESSGDETVELFIPTGGSTGGIKFVRHTRRTLRAAAAGLAEWFDDAPIRSVCFLPLFHVSGLMQLIRAWVSSGKVIFAKWPSIQDGNFPRIARGSEKLVTSLVPTQLARLMSVPDAADWLRTFDAVFVGGAPMWPELAARARAGRVPLAPCYGSTETAAQVVAVRPAQFLAGNGTAGEVLPHARIEIVDTDGAPAGRGVAGVVKIVSRSLFLGYWPEPARRPDAWLTADRGRLDVQGRLQVLGRLDTIINSGGEKIEPEVVEEAIRATGRVHDVAVCGMRDLEWGEAVVAVLSGSESRSDVELLQVLRKELSPHQVPKKLIHVAELPRTPAGKIDRAALTRMVERGESRE